MKEERTLVVEPIYLSREAFKPQGLIVAGFNGLAGAYFVDVQHPDADTMVALLEQGLRKRGAVEIVFTRPDSRIISVTPVI